MMCKLKLKEMKRSERSTEQLGLEAVSFLLSKEI